MGRFHERPFFIFSTFYFDLNWKLNS
jgi:hypothetical protein